MKLEVTAPGKSILHGEHAVVFKKAAIAVSLSLKTVLTLASHNEDKVILILKNLGLSKKWDLNVLNDISYVYAAGDIISADEDNIKKLVDVFDLSEHSETEKLALITFLYLCVYISKSYNAGSFPSCTITIDSELSVGSGMGSSASYSVCLSTAILIICGRITPRLLPEDKELINKWSYEAEKIFHGRPSGIDNSICTYGGALRFENGCVTDMLSEMHGINMLLVNTKVPRNTKDLVANVKKRHQLHTSVIEPVLNAMHAISDECWTILKDVHNTCLGSDHAEALQDLINMNHHLLNCIGVGHPKLTQICEIAQKFQCAAKLTGAGGGGCAIILLPFKDVERHSIASALKEELECCNFDVWDIVLGTSGVQVKFKNA